MNINEIYHCFLQCNGISTDSRNIAPDSLFIALKGEHFDANTFAAQALEKGAQFAIIDNKKFFTDKERMILVSDTLETLQILAQYHRIQLGLPIIALTGSNGKTTTKELLTKTLAQRYQVGATVGNLNNHIGVPLTLLSFDEDTDIGIVEMGANHKGEIAFLCQIAMPNFGYITNFGKAHLEGFGGFEGVIKAKSELYEYLEDHKKTAFVNMDDPRQDAKTTTFDRYTFGVDLENDVVIRATAAQPNACITLAEGSIESQLTGLYNISNIAAATTIAHYFGVPFLDIKTAIQSYTPNNNRSQWVTIQDSNFLLDAYNANPSSMEAAISNFLQLESPKSKILVLGDMFELGSESLKEHRALLDKFTSASELKLKVYCIGHHFKEAKSNRFMEDVSFFDNTLDFIDYITKDNPFKNAMILVKGSRGMELERILEAV